MVIMDRKANLFLSSSNIYFEALHQTFVPYVIFRKVTFYPQYVKYPLYKLGVKLVNIAENTKMVNPYIKS